jgi:N-acetylmuramate 1-kinase
MKTRLFAGKARSPLPEELDLSRIAAGLGKKGLEPEAIAKLAGDASSRVYYRASYGLGCSAVIMVLSRPHTRDEEKFLEIHQFMESLGLPVPRIYAHDSDHGLIVLEDLGDDLLETIVDGSSENRLCELYTEAVDLLIELRLKTSGKASACESFNPPFDKQKFTEELRFFVVHFLKGLLKIDLSASAGAALEALFDRITLPLSRGSRIFCHRDFHSRNLMYHGARLVMIDFQDARMGPAQYDLASLLRDSYVTLPEHLVDELIDRYQQGIDDVGNRLGSQFRYLFDVMSLQRNMKALGTFGYQISVRGADRYLSSIPRTGAYISSTIRLHKEFAPFVPLVEDYISGPALEMR